MSVHQHRAAAVLLILLLAVCSLWTPAHAAGLGSRTLYQGMRGEDVRELQLMLAELGFFQAQATGYYGSVTKAAVTSFQKSHGLTVDGIAGPQTIGALRQAVEQSNKPGVYVVRAGDTLWLIAQRYGLTVAELKQYNGLTSDIIYVGQNLYLEPVHVYRVQAGDSLWKIATKYGITVERLMRANNLTGTEIYVGQMLNIPEQDSTSSQQPQPVYSWPEVTYVVQPGDTISGIAQKFGVSAQDIMRYNYMEPGEWLNAGEKIAISGYAPRTYTVTPGEDSAPKRTGKLVDWFLEGQYLLKRNDVFTIIDTATGKQFKVKMMGGYNHADVEPLTTSDTAIMKALFGGSWQWQPRPVVVYHDGMNIAASLSGMPHSFDSLPDNNVSGHFDLYLYNSKSHGSTSTWYQEQHRSMVLQAASRVS